MPIYRPRGGRARFRAAGSAKFFPRTVRENLRYGARTGGRTGTGGSKLVPQSQGGAAPNHNQSSGAGSVRLRSKVRCSPKTSLLHINDERTEGPAPAGERAAVVVRLRSREAGQRSTGRRRWRPAQFRRHSSLADEKGGIVYAASRRRARRTRSGGRVDRASEVEEQFSRPDERNETRARNAGSSGPRCGFLPKGILLPEKVILLGVP